jgi:hypothetical protein
MAASENTKDRVPTAPEGQGPLIEDLNAATKHPVARPSVPLGSEVEGGWRRRDYLWPEVHDAFDTDREVVDPRATGDPVGNRRRRARR